MERSTSKPIEVRDVVVLGFGGHGREIASFIRRMEAGGQGVRLAGFADDSPEKKGLSFAGATVLGPVETLPSLLAGRGEPLFYITAFGDNRVRASMVERVRALKTDRIRPWTLLHPDAFFGGEFEAGEGTAVFPRSVLTTQVKIGAHCIVNVLASLSHDSVIGDFTNINPGVRVCGNVTIGPFCYIGAGATVIDKVSIGPGTVVGAGATVVDPLPENVLAVGTPARIIKRF